MTQLYGKTHGGCGTPKLKEILPININATKKENIPC